MIRVFIADDEAPARERLRELLQDIATDVPNVVAGEARNGIEALERLPASAAQVLLVDIRMPGMDGLELARHVAGMENAPAVVFVTAHDKHAIEAFELSALDYLLKPVRAERLAAALKKAAAGGAPRRENLERAAGAPREYLTVRTREREYLIEESLVALEREFSGPFVRIHRNCLVARDAVRGFERAGGGDEEAHWQVVLDGFSERLPVSRRQWPTVRELIADK